MDGVITERNNLDGLDMQWGIIFKWIFKKECGDVVFIPTAHNRSCFKTKKDPMPCLESVA
jgi:hypothetical protein